MVPHSGNQTQICQVRVRCINYEGVLLMSMSINVVLCGQNSSSHFEVHGSGSIVGYDNVKQ